jgi:ArsR family transcriptional regulator
VTDLASLFELSQATVSVHVKVLREAGLLESRKSGNQTVYRARPETLRRILDESLEELFDPTLL